MLATALVQGFQRLRLSARATVRQSRAGGILLSIVIAGVRQRLLAKIAPQGDNEEEEAGANFLPRPSRRDKWRALIPRRNLPRFRED